MKDTSATAIDYRMENRYLGISVIVAFLSLLIGAVFGLLQVMERAPRIDIVSANTYYMSLTGHGVLMALVFTTFFILGLSTYVTSRTLQTTMASSALNAVAYILAIGGSAATTVAILAGNSSVLYTFYPPMKASTVFYVGATTLVVGTWVYAANIFLTVRKWRRAGNRGRSLPLATYAVVATLIVWILATLGLAVEMLVLLIPWSAGLVDRVDPLMARNLFWYFGHPLVYFLLLPAYIVWYTILPRILGTTIFSSKLARLAFAMFILFSVPVGYHHQFMDPGITSGWKYFHTVLTFFVFVPSLMTAFTITATMEKAARKNGGRGLLAWMGKLPWKEPTFAAVALSMIAFGFGGAGGAINAGFSMNAVVHNTAWIPGHLHLTVGTAVALTFMGVSYLVLPNILGRAASGRNRALLQIYSWFVGVAIFSTAMHAAGLYGAPRRSFEGSIAAAGAVGWGPFMAVAAVGGAIMFFSITLFVVNMMLVLKAPRTAVREELMYPDSYDETPGLMDNLKLLVPVAVVLILVAYVLPTLDIIHMDSPGAPPVQVSGR